MKVVLDTNVLSELMKPQGSKVVKNWVGKQIRANLFITTITQAEILYGIEILPDGRRSKALRESAQAMFIQDFAGQILTFDQKAAIYFAKIAVNRRKIGKPISQADAQIASICRSNNMAISTRNINDFTDCQIMVINPWDFQDLET